MAAPAMPRSAGILLHPTSLPGPFGIGDLGPVAYRWVETLAHMKQSWWQVLPLGPTGVGDSPYQSFSAFAGSVNLLSPEMLRDDGLVSDEQLSGAYFGDGAVEYDRVTPFKRDLLRAAWDAFRGGRAGHLKQPFEAFCQAEAGWLDDYALFMAIRESLDGVGLADWPTDLQRREPKAVAAAGRELAGEALVHKFGQFLFDRQWFGLKQFAADRGVKLIGDAPIFVAFDSADVWAHPDQFLLDKQMQPTAVAGVPPDYFAAEGQLWGNPLYDWDRMAATGYAWWVARLRRAFRQVDVVRLDHFRGFAAAWHVPAGEPTARHGKWVDGPGSRLFDKLKQELGTLPLIAEDLGLITPDVHRLREDFGFPGMAVLEFAVGGPDNLYWPHNYDRNTVAYTGTHDNDTVVGWYQGLADGEKKTLARYVGKAVTDPAWDLLRMAWASAAVLAVVPLQDVLSLGGEARMNKPGVPSGNWRWRFRLSQFRRDVIDRLGDLTVMYNRDPKPAKAAV